MQYRVLSTGSPPPPPSAVDDQVLRAFRVLRLFGRLRRLRAIIGGITSSIRPVLNAFLIIFVVASICEGRSPASRPGRSLGERRRVLPFGNTRPSMAATLGRALPFYGGETRPCAPILWRRN